MGDTTGISWADHTFNPWIGCQRVSEACDGCYAEFLMAQRFKRVEWGPGQPRKLTTEQYWRKPEQWNDAARAAGTRPFVFGGSLCDPFDNAVPREWRERYWERIASTPELVWLLLTKRPQLIRRMVDEIGYLPGNVALGTTVEHQRAASTNLPALLSCGLRPLFFFVSCEPLLERVDPMRIELTGTVSWLNAFTGELDISGQRTTARLGWVIAGGESDQGRHAARPMEPDWARLLRDEAALHGVPYHFKQWGEWGPAPVDITYESAAQLAGARDLVHLSTGETLIRWGRDRTGRELDGRLHDDRPEVSDGTHPTSARPTRNSAAPRATA